MRKGLVFRRNVFSISIALWVVMWGVMGWFPERAESSNHLLGGARGVVKSAEGEPLEGIMVQLISQKTAIRTTVYSDILGNYEFPKLETGLYTLRIARPLEFRPYRKDSVRIDGPVQLEDIVLERVTGSEYLPPTPDILGQLTDAEWLWNLPGTAQEKRVFSKTCGSGCHNYQWPFRSRYDERSWRLIVERMLRYQGRLLIDRIPAESVQFGQPGYQIVESEEDAERIVKWLASVRGPESKDPNFQIFQGPRGRATRVIVTEYELPSMDERPHDVVGDSKGYIWYTPNRRPVLGRLDPKTGAVKEYKVPRTPGKHSGSHWITVDKNGIIWFTESWANNLVKFDPSTEQLKKIPGTGGNKAIDPDGYLWGTSNFKIEKRDPETLKVLKEYPLKKVRGTYGNFVSPDGNFFGGGDPWQSDFDGVVFLDIRTGETWEVQTRSRSADPSRGGFDPEGNAWMGGRGSMLVKFDRKTKKVMEYVPPTPYVTMYEAKPDKNGEVWAGTQRGGRIARFNPKTEVWIDYVLPEPYSLDWRTWIDNSTDPVTVWYGDHNGYIVRLQPLD